MDIATPDIIEIVYYEIAVAAVKDAVQKLPPLQQKIIVQRFYDEREVNQIAREMNVHRTTVYRNMQAALEQLRGMLISYGVDEMPSFPECAP